VTDAEMNRLRWRCQRGMLELDHLLGRFLDTRYAEAPADIRRAFAALIELEDADLLDLIVDRERPAPPEFAGALDWLRRRD
jgi:antitoxin CptB